MGVLNELNENTVAYILDRIIGDSFKIVSQMTNNGKNFI